MVTYISIANREIKVHLSRRNIMSLLAKLDGNPPNSFKTIGKTDEDEQFTVYVTAEEDGEHYAGRLPGEMHPATEGRLLSSEERAERMRGR